MSEILIFCDAETAPTQDPVLKDEIFAKHVAAVVYPDLDAIVADGRLKDAEKIAEDIEKKKAKAIDDYRTAMDKAAAAAEADWRKTSFDGGAGHLASISFAFGDEKIVGFKNLAFDAFKSGKTPTFEDVISGVNGERRLIQLFVQAVEGRLRAMARARAEADWNSRNPRPRNDDDYSWIIDSTPDGSYSQIVMSKDNWIADHTPKLTPIFVAHHAQFDLRFIWQRAIVLGVKLPSWWPIDAQPWDQKRIHDTMLMWAGAKGTVGLDRLCRALGIPGKGDIDGSKVWDAIQAGRIDEVCTYCSDDVRRLRSVHQRLRGELPGADDLWELVDREVSAMPQEQKDELAAAARKTFGAAIANAEAKLLQQEASADEPWMDLALAAEDFRENATYEELLDASDFDGEQREKGAL
jgi:Predicted 3''-5'' exonuclease related to the exonuclease domain of PolB.